MAYSDYGGYAYRNGVRIVERSDFTLTPDGKGFESPGMWPGFGAIIAGMTPEEAEKIRSYPSGHAVLGDGPIIVCLYKQSSVTVYRGFDEVHLRTLPDVKLTHYTKSNTNETFTYVDANWYRDNDTPCITTIDGHKLEIWWVESDNYYQYVRLDQPDGVIWTGWSGYGVGAGLEDAGYGYNTQRCEHMMGNIWPDIGVHL